LTKSLSLSFSNTNINQIVQVWVVQMVKHLKHFGFKFFKYKIYQLYQIFQVYQIAQVWQISDKLCNFKYSFYIFTILNNVNKNSYNLKK